MTHLRFLPAIAALSLATLAPLAARAQTYLLVGPSAIDLSVNAINANGDLAGTISIDGGANQGFVYVRSTAAFTVFTVPGPVGSGTVATGINDDGTVVGSYDTNTQDGKGFIRTADGTITSYPGPFQNPGFATTLVGVNNRGDLLGLSGPYAGAQTAFVAYAAGGTQVIQDPNLLSASIVPTHIDDFGDVSGNESVGNQPVSQLFVSKSDGTFTPYSLPRSISQTQSSTGINNAGMAVGYGYDVACLKVFPDPCIYVASSAYLRDEGGQVHTFAVNEGRSTRPTFATAVNNAGVVAGHFSHGRSNLNSVTRSGFIRDAAGTIATFDVPGLSDTSATVINDAGVVAGQGVVPGGHLQAFIRLP